MTRTLASWGGNMAGLVIVPTWVTHHCLGKSDTETIRDQVGWDKEYRWSSELSKGLLG